MSYVERKMKDESILESTSLRRESLREEIAYLDKKKAEAQELDEEMDAIKERIRVLDETYEEGRQAADISKADLADVLNDLEGGKYSFDDARVMYGIDEVGEESDEAEAA